MAMGDALAAEYLKVGAVVIAHRFEFPDKTKAKYCVLLENYDPKRPNTIVALTTSNRRFRDRPWIIAIPPNTCGIATVSYLDCNNCWPLPTHELASSRKYQYIGQLPESTIEDIYLALEEAPLIPEEYLVRIFGE